MQHSRDCTEMWRCLQVRAELSGCSSWVKQPWTPCPASRLCKDTRGRAVLRWLISSCRRRSAKRRRNGFFYRVSLGGCWGDSPAGVGPTVSADLCCRIANMSVFGLHAGFLWFYRCARFSVTAQLLSLSCFMDQILNQGKIREDRARP